MLLKDRFLNKKIFEVRKNHFESLICGFSKIFDRQEKKRDGREKGKNLFPEKSGSFFFDRSCFSIWEIQGRFRF